jgi:hypothetical protein
MSELTRSEIVGPGMDAFPVELSGLKFAAVLTELFGYMFGPGVGAVVDRDIIYGALVAVLVDGMIVVGAGEGVGCADDGME